MPGAGGSGQPSTRRYRVTFMTNVDLERYRFTDILNEYRRTSPKVEVETVVGGLEKLRTLIAAGTPPDVSRLNDNYVLQFALDQVTQPMDPYLKQSGLRRKDFYELIYDVGIFGGELGGKRYAWPMGAAPRLLYLNLDLFRQAGGALPPNHTWDVPGWTMEDFLETAQRLSRPPEQWGTLIFHNTGYEQTWAVNFGHPTGVFSKDGKHFTLADPLATEAIQWVVDLSTRHQVQPAWDTAREQGNWKLFAAGKIGMLYDTFARVGRLREDLQFAWDVAPLPKKKERRTVNSLITYVIPAGAKEPQGGWDVLEFFAGPFAAQVFAETGYVIPPHRTYAQEVVKAGEGQPPKAIHLFVEALDYHTLPSLAARNVSELRKIYRPELYGPVHRGERTAREMLTSVRPAVEALLQQ
ncbi:MAG: ABC transporter substrate-binding protein [Chloroflexota bacterium]